MIKRSTAIGWRYGLTSRSMDRILNRFRDILETYDAKATFPITSAALARSRNFADKYQGPQMEFAAHGYYHVDHVQLPLADQVEQIGAASRLFTSQGIMPTGFRCPYLRWDDNTIAAIRQAGFQYDSSQALAWDVVDGAASESYRRVMQFYRAVKSEDYPALPRWDDDLVRIPYCLPDDEALIDRLTFASSDAMNRIWLAILTETYHLGELFTLGLHPERLDLCETALVTALQHASELRPQVWFARLDEIVTWWKARTNASVAVRGGIDAPLEVEVHGPPGLTVQVRNLPVAAETVPWYCDFKQVQARSFQIQSCGRPFIGVSPASAPYLSHFLRQQGFIVEEVSSGEAHSLYLDLPHFAYEDERALLAQIEAGEFPLIRLGRWPDGARSALCVTGDIDALTIWDYGLRFLGS